MAEGGVLLAFSMADIQFGQAAITPNVDHSGGKSQNGVRIRLAKCMVIPAFADPP
jgi:hypothetical protein